MALANYEDRFVIPTTHREVGADAYELQRIVRLLVRQQLLIRGQRCDAVLRRPIKTAGEEPHGDIGMTMKKRARTFKVLSALLSYPSEDLRSATEELKDVLRTEGIVSGGQLTRLESFIDEFRDRDIYDLQERYTLLLIALARCRSISSSMCLEKAATAARPWWILHSTMSAAVLSYRAVNCPTICRCFSSSCR